MEEAVGRSLAVEGVVGTAVVEVAETVAAAALAGSHCRTVVEVARRSRCCMEVEVTVRRTAVDSRRTEEAEERRILAEEGTGCDSPGQGTATC